MPGHAAGASADYEHCHHEHKGLPGAGGKGSPEVGIYLFQECATPEFPASGDGDVAAWLSGEVSGADRGSIRVKDVW
jgi:hypothetical protein